jgi:hypothetical protein
VTSTHPAPSDDASNHRRQEVPWANHSSVIEAESRIRTGPWYPALRVSPAAVEGASARWRWRGLPMGQAVRPRLLRNNGSRAGAVKALQVPILSPDVCVALPSREPDRGTACIVDMHPDSAFPCFRLAHSLILLDGALHHASTSKPCATRILHTETANGLTGVLVQGYNVRKYVSIDSSKYAPPSSPLSQVPNAL